MNNNNGYYPAGVTGNEDAICNPEPAEQSFDVIASYTLSKETEITTTNYSADRMNNPQVDYENQTYTPIEIISACLNFAKEKLEHTDNFREQTRLLLLIDSCKGWVEDEAVVEQN